MKNIDKFCSGLACAEPLPLYDKALKRCEEQGIVLQSEGIQTESE